MTDPKPGETKADNFGAIAVESTNAGIADESAAYDIAAQDEEEPEVKSIDEGDPKTTSDGSGTSETD